MSGKSKAKEVSLAKVEANRENAKLSTGPISKEGKAMVKWNAIKHGLLAREVVIKRGDGKESLREFNALFKNLYNELAPVGIVEELLVERLVVAYWRLRRVIKVETGGIRDKLDNTREDFEERIRDNYVKLFDDNFYSNKIREANIQFIEMRLASVQGGIEEIEYNKKPDYDRIIENLKKRYPIGLGDGDYIKAFGVFPFNIIFNVFIDRSREEGYSDKLTKKIALDYLKREQYHLETLKEKLEVRNEARLEVELLKGSIPPEAELSWITRYETTIERQFYKALNEIERLQKQRLGYG